MVGRSAEPDRDALSLEQIERDVWGDPPAEATYLVRTAHELRRKPIGTLTPEDLRLLLGQKIGVDALLPSALRLLAADPLVEGDFYPGDLLRAAVRIPAEYWADRASQAAAIRKIARAAKEVISSFQDDSAFLLADIDAFLALTEQQT